MFGQWRPPSTSPRPSRPHQRISGARVRPRSSTRSFDVAVGRHVHGEAVDPGAEEPLELLADRVGVAPHEERHERRPFLVRHRREVDAAPFEIGEQVGLRLVGGGGDARRALPRHGDLRTVATELLAVLVERLELAADLVRLADDVRLVRVLGRHPQRLLLAAAPDHHGDARHRRRLVHRLGHLVPLAGEGRPLPAEHRDHDLQRLLELLEAIGERSELDAERCVFPFVPPGADPELGAAVGDDVERRHGLGQHRRMAVGVARDQRTQPDRRRLAGQGGEEAVALEHVRVRVAQVRQLVEVVHHQHRVEAGGVGLTGLRRDGVEQLGGADAGVGEVRDLVAEAGHHRS